jgi:hypothetical protein
MSFFLYLTSSSMKQTSSAITLLALNLALPTIVLSKPLDDALKGCWEGKNVRQYISDGRFRDQSTVGRVEYQSTKIVTESKEVRIEYRYEIVRPSVYSATMSAHTHRPDLIGSTREYEYRIEKDRLFITTYPQTTKPAPPTVAVKVESESVRVGTTCEFK